MQWMQLFLERTLVYISELGYQMIILSSTEKCLRTAECWLG